MAVSVRGCSSVMPCLDRYGRLSTLCLLLSWQLPAQRGAVGVGCLGHVLSLQKMDGSVFLLYQGAQQKKYSRLYDTYCH